MRRLPLGVSAVLVASWAITGCGDNDESSTPASEPAAASNGEFCESMDHLISLLTPSERTSPTETEATFTEAVGWFDQARRSAPASISHDVAVYASAYDEYLDFLDEAGFNLDVVFSTDEGRDLAIDTSHTLTVPIVDYTTVECGLSFVDEG